MEADSGGGSMWFRVFIDAVCRYVKITGIEFNDLVRKSAFSFTLTNNKVRFFQYSK